MLNARFGACATVRQANVNAFPALERAMAKVVKVLLLIVGTYCLSGKARTGNKGIFHKFYDVFDLKSIAFLLFLMFLRFWVL